MNSSNNDSCSNSTSTNNSIGGRDLGLYFLDQARLCSAAAPSAMDEAEAEEAPTELNTINSSGGFLVVSTDKLSVKYTSVNLHGHDVGAVQANRPAPFKRLLYYFEMYVKDAGVKGQVSIGFTSESFKMRRQPGWEANSCGYHGDDGLLYRGGAKGEPFGPTYATGDVVGGGINYASQEFFFTKNGAVVGTVYKDMKGPLFPTVAVHSQNEEVHVNFGQKPFDFDLKTFEAQERLKQQATIEKISLPPNVSYEIVRSYLLHYGYEDTLNSLYMAGKSTVPPVSMNQENGFDEQDLLYALSQRKTLRQLIRNGEIDAAFSRLHEWYPQIVQDDKSATCFLLHCQKFIELVRVGKLEEAVKYGRIELSKYFSLARFEELVQDCVALLAYERPMESFAGYLLEDSQREVVADMVNAMILSTNPNVKDLQGCLHSYLERLLRQLTACCLERRSLNGDQGEGFHLHRALNSTMKANS
ncbi:ran-binding protein M homolog [Punica granatum]|uniref:Ran-binding protein M homolog n=1 Tax=Punica granatum TaxID=22663 RepID=A0A218XJZ2_PUNGR|nr:ran-binding protein M homolog [Punica granatum]OWM85090.1 hypothetical protein CDL15_Pgr027877 [Punica granatum]